VSSAPAAAAGLVASFWAAPAGFAVVGASTSRAKFGNKLLRCYMQNGKAVIPVHPAAGSAEIEGLACVASLKELPGGAERYGVSVVTPPAATLGVLREAASLGVGRLWLQPGSESAEVLRLAEELGLALLHSGPCVLAELGFDERWEPSRTLAQGHGAEGAVRWSLDDRFVMTITLSNARRRNPLTHHVLVELRRLLHKAEDEERGRVRAVVVASEGPVFSSGHDFGDFLESRGQDAHALTLSLCSSVNMALQNLPQPTIAAVQGLATAAGCQLACSCDLIVASTDAAFQLPGAKGAGFCHTPAVAVAARGNTRLAMEMALLSEKIPAARAELMGLVNIVVPPADLAGKVRQIAEQISMVSPPDNMQKGKHIFYEQVAKSTLEDKYAVAEPAMLDMFSSPDYQETMNKFFSVRRKSGEQS